MTTSEEAAFAAHPLSVSRASDCRSCLTLSCVCDFSLPHAKPWLTLGLSYASGNLMPWMQQNTA